jgi:hypothetical protein
MTHANTFGLSPGPGYNPSRQQVHTQSARAVIGTSRRFGRGPMIVK